MVPHHLRCDEVRGSEAADGPIPGRAKSFRRQIACARYDSASAAVRSSAAQGPFLFDEEPAPVPECDGPGGGEKGAEGYTMRLRS